MEIPVAFETSRLLARMPHLKDIPAMVEYLSDPSISDTTLTIPYPYSESDAYHWINKSKEEWINGLAYTFVLELRSTGELIGAVGLHMISLHDRAEAGYWIAEPFWNQGYATEALTGLLKFGFDGLKLNKVFATHMDQNPSSGRVMIKAGMKHEGNLRAHYKKGEEYVNVVQYAILKNEF